MRFKRNQAFHNVSAKAADAERALQSGIAQVDALWMDPTRAQFEIRHLAPLRADARALRTELEKIAQLSDAVIRDLRDR